MGLGIPPLRIKIMFESNPVKSIMLVWRLAVVTATVDGDRQVVLYIMLKAARV